MAVSRRVPRVQNRFLVTEQGLNCELLLGVPNTDQCTTHTLRTAPQGTSSIGLVRGAFVAQDENITGGATCAWNYDPRRNSVMTSTSKGDLIAPLRNFFDEGIAKIRKVTPPLPCLVN